MHSRSLPTMKILLRKFFRGCLYVRKACCFWSMMQCLKSCCRLHRHILWLAVSFGLCVLLFLRVAAAIHRCVSWILMQFLCYSWNLGCCRTVSQGISILLIGLPLLWPKLSIPLLPFPGLIFYLSPWIIVKCSVVFDLLCELQYP